MMDKIFKISILFFCLSLFLFFFLFFTTPTMSLWKAFGLIQAPPVAICLGDGAPSEQARLQRAQPRHSAVRTHHGAPLAQQSSELIRREPGRWYRDHLLILAGDMPRSTVLVALQT